jgi:hypothetical protein
MTVYELLADANRYESLDFLSVEVFMGFFGSFDGKLMADRWTAPEVRLARERKHRGRPASDYPFLCAGLAVFSERAVAALRDLLEDAGEILPLPSPDGSYSACNVTRVVDALDREQSEIAYFDDGRIMHVRRYVFLADRLADVPLFKLAGFEKGRIYVTDAFVQRAKEHGLVGFWFDPLWTDEPGHA